MGGGTVGNKQPRADDARQHAGMGEDDDVTCAKNTVSALRVM